MVEKGKSLVICFSTVRFKTKGLHYGLSVQVNNVENQVRFTSTKVGQGWVETANWMETC